MTDRPPNNEPTQATDSQTDLAEARPPLLVWALPIGVVILIMLVAPNFQQTDGVRAEPLGGDFLQEWVGGTIITSPQRNRLYDLEYAKSIQHDPSIVGFEDEKRGFFPMVYPPFFYAAVSPLAKISYPVAIKVWAVLSALAFSLTGFLLYRCYGPIRKRFAICFVAALFFSPLLLCFNMGQKSTFLLLILTATFVLLHSRRPFWAGLVFGLVAFKPHLGIVIGVAMLIKRQWKFAIGAMLTALVLVGGSFLIAPQLCHGYIQVVTNMGDYVQTSGYQLADSHGLWGASQLTFGGLPANGVKLIAAALSVGVIGLVGVGLRGPIQIDSREFTIQFSMLVIAMVMLSPHFYAYDLTILLLPMMLIVSLIEPDRWRSKPQTRMLIFVLAGLFALSGLFTKIATLVSFQTSIVLMVAFLVLLPKVFLDRSVVAET